MLFPNYINFKILNYLLNYLLLKNNSKFLNKNKLLFTIDRLFLNFNELLNYIFVCKIWYFNIQDEISKNIIDYENYEKWFIKWDYKYDGNGRSNIKNNNKNDFKIRTDFIFFEYPIDCVPNPIEYNSFKIKYHCFKLKVNNSIWTIININQKLIQKYLISNFNYYKFDDLKNRNNDRTTISSNSSKEIKILPIFEDKFKEFIKYPNELIPNNLKININLKEEVKMVSNYQNLIDDDECKEYQRKDVNSVKVNTCSYKPTLNYFKYINPKKLEIVNGSYKILPITYEFISNYFPNFHQLEELKLEYGRLKLEPLDLININQDLPLLKTLSISLYFHYICKLFNYINENKCKKIKPHQIYHESKYCRNSCQRYEYFFDCDEYYDNIIPILYKKLLQNLTKNPNHWNEMINQLSENKTILNFTISDGSTCNRNSCCSEKANITNSKVSLGFKQIFEQNNTIKYLKLVEIDSLDDLALSGLLNNKSIQTLVLTYKDTQNHELFDFSMYKYLFSKILNNDNQNSNSSIQHLKITNKSFIGPYLQEDDSMYRLKYDGASYYFTKFIPYILKMINKYPNSKLYSIQLPFCYIENNHDLFKLFSNQDNDHMFNRVTIKEFIFVPNIYYQWDTQCKEKFLLKINKIRDNLNNLIYRIKLECKKIMVLKNVKLGFKLKNKE